MNSLQGGTWDVWEKFSIKLETELKMLTFPVHSRISTACGHGGHQDSYSTVGWARMSITSGWI